MVRMFLYLCMLFSVVHSFTIEFPYGTNFMVKVKGINLLAVNQQTKEDLQYLFKTTPVVVFENQYITPEDQYFISTWFDSNYLNKKIHPFYETEVPSIDQVAIRGKGMADHFGVNDVEIRNARSFKYTPLWHQDVVGNKWIMPPLVSSMYMIKTPETGGFTSFASMENAYESLSVEDRKICNEINCIYSPIHGYGAQVDFTGYGRLDKYWEETMTKEKIDAMSIQPLVIYPTAEDTKRSLMLTPNKLYKFEGDDPGKTPAYTQEKIRYLMHNHVLREGNVGKLHYKENDLVIFNNRKVMHTSSPLEEYKEDCIFSLLFLATKTPIYNSSMAL